MTSFSFNTDCLKTEIDDEIIVLNTNTGKYLKLNSSSKFILNCIENYLDEKEILKKICSYYNVSESNAELSLKKFVKAALEKNIIHKN
jgi:hypothetical protein